MEEEPGATRPRRPLLLAAPAAWALFAWALVLVASQAESASFDFAIRGTAIVLYPSGLVFVSPAFDRALFVAAGAAVLALGLWPSSSGRRPRSQWVLGVALGAGLVAYLAVNPLFLALVAVAGAGLAAEGASKLASDAGSKPSGLLATSALFFVSVLALVGVAGAVRWVVGGFGGSPPLHGATWYPAIASAQLLGTLAPMIPEIALLFFFGWAVRLGLGSLHKGEWAHDGESPRPARDLKLSLYLLLAGTVVAAFVGAYPYLKAVNPSSILVGVDVRACYLPVLQNAPTGSPCGGPHPAPGSLAALWGADRSGAVWVLVQLAAAAGSPGAALKLAPALWGVFLAVSTWVFVMEGTGEGTVAGMAALLTGVSTQVVAGIDAGLLADWLGLSLAFLFLAAVLRGVRKKQVLYVLPAFALFAALLATHPWTWSVTLVVLITFLALELVQAGAERRLGEKKFEVAMVLSLVGLGAMADLARRTLPLGSGFLLSVQTLAPSLSLSNVPVVAANLEQTLDIYLGGALANPLWFLLGIAGVLAIPSLKGAFGKLLVSWVGAMSIGVLLVGPPTNLLQSRMMYDTPVQVFAAIGVVSIIGALSRALVASGWSPKTAGRWVAALLTVSVFGLGLAFALEYVGFLYL